MTPKLHIPTQNVASLLWIHRREPSLHLSLGHFPLKLINVAVSRGGGDVWDGGQRILALWSFCVPKGQIKHKPKGAPHYPSPSGGSPEQASWLICFSFGMQSAGTYAYPLGNSIFFIDAWSEVITSSFSNVSACCELKIYSWHKSLNYGCNYHIYKYNKED